jgi:NAD(P)-dependent dehydrogenase (short-subunit alcohol dehydrogenase family)
MCEQGATVSVIARSEDKLAELCSTLNQSRLAAAYFVADVSNQQQLIAAIDGAENTFGSIDGLFANAGIGGATVPLVDYTDEDFDEIINTNVKSFFWGLKRVLPSMIARKSGSVVATGSLASERGLVLTSGYNASKHAVLGLVRSAAAEVAVHNVRVNCILPGLIQTPLLASLADELSGGDQRAGLDQLGRMVPQGRVGSPEELANVAAFLMSDAASYVNGQSWAVDGGVLATINNGG